MHVNDILLRHDLQAISERLYRNVDWSGGPMSCWPWQLRTKKGYGMMNIGDEKHPVLAHRLSYVIANGALPLELRGEPVCVLHHCDNRPCCNPAHLFIGTNQDNVDDMVAKNRQSRGEKHHWTKLTEADVRAILASRETATILSQRYGVALNTLYNLRTRKTWRHITDVVMQPPPSYKGEAMHNAILTEADIRAIRADTRSHRLIGLAYGVSRRHVGKIKERAAWRHVE